MRGFLRDAATADETRKKELLAAYDKAEAEERAISEQIARHDNLDAAERRAAADHISDIEQRQDAPKAGKAEAHRAAFRNWFINGAPNLSAEERSLLAEYRGTSTQVAGTTTLGGYTVPQDFLAEMERALKDYSGIFQAARILRTDKGNALPMPTEDDTSTVAALVTEGSASTVQDLTIGQKQLDAYSFRSLMKISWELMQDSAFSWEEEARLAFGPRFGRALNTYCTTGTGSSQPNGVVVASTLGKTAASATAITFAEILDLKHSVDPAYRMNGAYMLHDNILLALKKLSIGSSDARPLWSPSYREGVPDTIDGSRYYINQGMASALTTGQKVMLYGDFSKYIIRMVRELTVIRLNERYADDGVVGFLGFMRFDGECTNTAAIKHLITA